MVLALLFGLSFVGKVFRWNEIHKVTKGIVIFPLYISWASNLYTVLEKTYFHIILGIKWYQEMKMMEMSNSYMIKKLL